LGGDLVALARLLDGPFAGLFRGVHILPPFPSSGDRGFAPISYREIDPRFGSWADIHRIAASHEVLLDLMVNHLSRQSPEFRDFEVRGRAAASADLFVMVDKVWPDGVPSAEDLDRIALRKPGGPITSITVESTGATERIWTSFGSADWSEQVDLDVGSTATRELIASWLRLFAEQGVRMVRLDAVGYVIKRAGTSCFMVEPEMSAFLDWITGVAGSLGLVVLPEVHDRYATHERLAGHGFWTYDFVLPGLVLVALLDGEADRLAAHLERSPDRQFTTLDCHDGIPIRPDLDGILAPAEMLALATLVQTRGGNVNRILARPDATGVDIHQLNVTYRSALGDDERYLTARAIQLFAKGVPQIYYVGLLAGTNDDDAVARTGDGRALNRRDYTVDEIGAALGRPVVRRLLDLVRLRNTHPAFDGSLRVESDGRSGLRLVWTSGSASCALEVDLGTGRATVRDGARTEVIAGT
jgi:sucrose phosphorylase